MKLTLFILIITTAALFAKGAAVSLSNPLDYEVVKIPAGKMTYELPINSYIQVEYLKVPLEHKKDYYLGKYEVTQAQWSLCVADKWCRPRTLVDSTFKVRYPVVKVTWHDAHRFAQWLSKKTGRNYRLPTEHEWFYAAGEGKYRREEDKQYNYSNIEEIRKTPKKIYPTGHFGENKWGVSDVNGNVWEWTLACYALAEETLLAPQNANLLNDPSQCATRITGGEHRAHVPDFIEDTYNGGCATLKPASNLGFRLVWEK